MFLHTSFGTIPNVRNWCTKNIVTVNIQSVMITQDLVRVKMPGYSGQSWGCWQYSDCWVWALAIAAVNSRTCISPSNEGLRHILRVLFNTSFLAASRLFFVRHLLSRPGRTLVSTDFHTTTGTRLPLVTYIQQITHSTMPSSSIWLHHVNCVNFWPTPPPPPTARRFWLSCGKWPFSGIQRHVYQTSVVRENAKRDCVVWGKLSGWRNSLYNCDSVGSLRGTIWGWRNSLYNCDSVGCLRGTIWGWRNSLYNCDSVGCLRGTIWGWRISLHNCDSVVCLRGTIWGWRISLYNCDSVDDLHGTIWGWRNTLYNCDSMDDLHGTIWGWRNSLYNCDSVGCLRGTIWGWRISLYNCDSVDDLHVTIWGWRNSLYNCGSVDDLHGTIWGWRNSLYNCDSVNYLQGMIWGWSNMRTSGM